MKRCCKCKKIKALSEFSKNVTKKDKLQDACKPCSLINSKKWYADNVDEHASKSLVRKYGITLKQKIEMLTLQNNCCAMCGDKIMAVSKACVDHCHSSRTLREILCNHCNLAIGHLKDSIERFNLGILYLEKHAKENTAAPIPTRPNTKGKDNTQLGTIPTTGAGEDGDNIDHHSGTIRRQDAYHSPQASGPDGMGCGNKQVATSQQLDLLENIRQ